MSNKDSKGYLRQLRLKAAEGVAHSQFELGQRYEKGEGVAQNDQTASRWYRKAAKQGHADAMVRLGNFYKIGRGVKKNFIKSTLFYLDAVKLGSEEGLKHLVLEILEPVSREEFEEIHPRISLRRHYTSNDFDVAKEVLATHTGIKDAECQFVLGFWLFVTDAIGCNIEKARALLNKAARRGHVRARRLLDAWESSVAFWDTGKPSESKWSPEFDALNDASADEVQKALRQFEFRLGTVDKEKGVLGCVPPFIGPKGVQKLLRGFSDCFVRTHVPVYKEVSNEELDRKGSLICIPPFISEEYPWVCGRYFDQETELEIEDMDCWPLVQLDLDQIRKETGVDVGSGLLQVWAHPDDWGRRYEDYVRLIPRSHVTVTEPTQERAMSWYLPSKVREKALLVYEELELDWESANIQDCLAEYAHWRSWSQMSWPIFQAGRRQLLTATQIVGWRPGNKAVPLHPLIGFLESCVLLDELEGVRATLKKSLGGVKSSNFASRALFQFNDSIYVEEEIVDGWKPLFTFTGPYADPIIVDEHVILYRKHDGEFQYQCLAGRWY